MDGIIAMYSRVLASPGEEPPPADVVKHIGGFVRNNPELALLFDIEGSSEVELDGRQVHTIPIKDPDRFANVVEAFAARFGLAMFFETFGRPAAPNAVIRTRMYSNVQLFRDEYPIELLQHLGLPRTLAMGKMAVAHQFRYWPGVGAIDPAHFGVFAAFREAFGVLAIVIEGIEDNEEGVFRPGFLKGYQP